MPPPEQDHEALGIQECLRLLGTTAIGRVAYTEAALPAIRPVLFTLRDGAVVIPVHTDSELAHAVRGAVVAFEADSYDDGTAGGWSVTVIGPSRLVSTGRPDDPDGCFIAVGLGVVRGWRTVLTPTIDPAGPVDETSARA